MRKQASKAKSERRGSSSPKDITGMTTIKDSGERRIFDTGAQRDRGQKKGFPHLRAVHALNVYDRHNQNGAEKYKQRNWELGMPLSEYWNSAQRHADKLLAGYDDEDHEGGWIWNVAHFIETKHRIKVGLLPKELDDMPNTFQGLNPNF
jgi:hypothetical protein